jgi:hypothetical protein
LDNSSFRITGDSKLRGIFQQIALKVQAAFNRFDVKSHGAALSFSKENTYPVFIIGAPRSGSTLLYQLLVKHSRIAYISNLMSLIPAHMINLARLTRLCHNYGHIKESQRGYIRIVQPQRSRSGSKKMV